MKITKLINKKPTVFDTYKKPLALITGASCGIGNAFARHFASKGYDLIVVARDVQRLSLLESTLLNLFNTKVHVIPVDLTKIDSINVIEEYLKNEGLNIDALVNNAGFGIHGAFQETDLKKEVDMVNLQINSTLALTKLVLPYMQSKKSGYILNVGSVYSFAPVPFQSVYGGCKSFLLSFSSSIAHENKKYGIKVTTLCPGITNTEFRTRSKVGKYNTHNTKNLRPKKPSGMSAEIVAEQGYNALMRGDLVVVPGLTNRIFVHIASHLPTSFLSPALALVNSFRGVNSKNS